MVEAMYELSHVCEDPRFDGFVANRFKGLGVRWHDDGTWEPNRWAEKWKSLRVDANKQALWHDFPSFNVLDDAFSARAVEALREFLEPNGELLPLITPTGSFFAFNCTTVADVLDRAKSDIAWVGEGRRRVATHIPRFEVYGERLSPLSIFRLPEIRNQRYVTQRFVDRVREAGLVGFEPVKVWPFPPGVDWRREWVLQREARAKRGLPKGQTPEKESVVVRLALSRGNKGTPLERAAIDSLMDQLDVMLVEGSAAGPLKGSLKGHEFVGKECDLYLVCPDARKLVAMLTPWASKLAWEGEVQLVERKAAWDVAEGKERIVALDRAAPREGAPRLAALSGLVPTEHRE